MFLSAAIRTAMLAVALLWLIFWLVLRFVVKRWGLATTAVTVFRVKRSQQPVTIASIVSPAADSRAAMAVGLAPAGRCLDSSYQGSVPRPVLRPA